MNDSCEIEVVWDCESPTPSAWKRFQVASISNDTSPVNTRKYPSMQKHKKKVFVDTGPSLTQYERSKKEVAVFLSEWQKLTSQNNEESENDEDQDNSFIPKFACNFTDSESDDDTPAIPKFNGVNSSLDKLFDTPGSEEYKYFCTPTVQEDKENKIEIDVWDEDDDLFADTSLMNNLDKKLSEITCTKKSASTPYPLKHKGTKRKKLDSNITNSKSIALECADIFLTKPKSLNRKPCTSKYGKPIIAPCKKATCSVDSGISEEILSQLMMDDSWCDKSFTTTSINKQQNKQQTPKNNNENKKVKHYNKSSNNHHPMSAADIKKTSTSINEWGDLFDDGDDAMLIEATVLTESQQMKETTSVSTKKLSPKLCSLKEIERKKREALKRRNMRMKK